jgi:ADP-ribosylglycohydrolase
MTHEAEEQADRLSRATACLYGVAVGDIIGRAGSWHTTESIFAAYGAPIQDLVKREPSAIKGKTKWLFGETSDDTEFTCVLAKTILRDKHVCRRSICAELKKVPERYLSAASCLWSLRKSDDLEHLRLDGHTSGAAMRCSPLGIVWSITEIENLVTSVIDSSVITHGDCTALSAACAVAAAISAAIDGVRGDGVIEQARRAAMICEAKVRTSALPAISQKIPEVYSLIQDLQIDLTLREDILLLRDTIARSCEIGRQACYLAPIAIALAVKFANAHQAIVAAANMGGDADTTASIAGAISAAIAADTLPSSWIKHMEDNNAHQLAQLARDLLSYRGKIVGRECTLWQEGFPVANAACGCRQPGWLSA